MMFLAGARGVGRAAWAAAGWLLVAGWAAPAQGRAVGAPVRVVATLPTLAAIAHEVGGRHVEVRALASAAEDPHFVDPRPDLMLALNRADLLLANGLDLEVGWLPPLQRAARNGRIQPGGPGYLEAAQFVVALEVPRGKIDRSMGDLHAGGNPHFLSGPQAVQAIARGLAQRLGAADPPRIGEYQANAEVFVRAVAKVEDEARARFASLGAAQRRVVAYHKSLAYLFDWLGLEEIGTIEPRPGVPPDPGHVSELLAAMRARGARTVVQEAYYPARGVSSSLARLAGGQLVVLPGGVRFDRHQDYVDFLAGLAERLWLAASAGGIQEPAAPGATPAP